MKCGTFLMPSCWCCSCLVKIAHYHCFLLAFFSHKSFDLLFFSFFKLKFFISWKNEPKGIYSQKNLLNICNNKFLFHYHFLLLSKVPTGTKYLLMSTKLAPPLMQFGYQMSSKNINYTRQTKSDSNNKLFLLCLGKINKSVI